VNNRKPPSARGQSGAATNGNGKPHRSVPLREPPYNIAAEQGVLGAILCDDDKISVVRARGLEAGHFYHGPHKIVYEVALGLDADGVRVNPGTVGVGLEGRGWEPGKASDLLTVLREGVPHSEDADYHAGIVLELWRKRAILADSQARIEAVFAKELTAEAILAEGEAKAAAIRWRASDLAATDRELGLTTLSTVRVIPLEWLWPNRVPLGKITLVAGEGGLGKSYMTLDWATIVSRGAVWPDDPGTSVEAGHVILLSAEDDLADTVVPRLKAMGADLDRIDALGTAVGKDGILTPFSLGDIGRLEQVIARRPGTRLIVIDPVTAFLGGRVDDNKNVELRAILGPLAEFAARHRVAIVCVTHFSKNSAAKAAARVIGSVAYSNAARATWCVAMDPEDDGRRLLMPVKNNLSPDRSGMAFTIADGVLAWEPEPIRVDINEILGGPPSRVAAGKAERLERAAAWLKTLLAEGSLPGEEVVEKAAAAGFGRNITWEAKALAGVRAFKPAFKGVWHWKLEPPSDTF
jgi:putative DNA primase/helicase